MDCEKLMALAERFLKQSDQSDIESLLTEGKLYTARVCVYKLLATQRECGNISDEEFSNACSEIGLDALEIFDADHQMPHY